VATGTIPNLASHPLPRLVEAGVTVTINSDDPMFSTTLNREYEVVADLARTAVHNSYAGSATKNRILTEIDEYEAGAQPG
jgi:aminodeoxyfutalosine deaminase